MKRIKYLTYNQARKYALALKLRTVQEWFIYCDKGLTPSIPKYPNRVYKIEWVSWHHFLGNKERKKGLLRKHYRPFKEARTFVHSLNINSTREWNNYCKSGTKPVDIPADPRNAYGNKWVSWIDWLNSKNINCHQKFLPFKKARAIARKLNLKSRDEWYTLAKKYEFAFLKRIPVAANKTYKKHWISWADWLGK